MRGTELIKKINALGRKNGIPVSVDIKRGKGSHRMLHFGGRRTTIKDPRKEIGPGLLAAILRRLGIDRKDL